MTNTVHNHFVDSYRVIPYLNLQALASSLEQICTCMTVLVIIRKFQTTEFFSVVWTLPVSTLTIPKLGCFDHKSVSSSKNSFLTTIQRNCEITWYRQILGTVFFVCFLDRLYYYLKWNIKVLPLITNKTSKYVKISHIHQTVNWES